MPRGSTSLRRSAFWQVVLLVAAPFGGAVAAPGELFDSEQPLSLRLEAPLRTVFQQRNDPEYQPAKLITVDEQGTNVAVDLRLRVRGKSRVLACEFPPLLLNFAVEQPAGSPFAGENRLKLVTHCDGAPRTSNMC